MKRVRQSTATEKGQSLTELAISFLILLLLAGGAIDIGRAFFSFIAIRDAAQEGAQYASYKATDLSGIEYRVRHSSNTPVDLTDPNIKVTITPHGNCAGTTGGVANWIKVDVVYDKFNFIMPLMGTFVDNKPFKLSATITETILAPVCP